LTIKPFVTLEVFGPIIFSGVLTAVKFYHQTLFIGDKIDDKVADGLLSSKFEAF
jgi:hypothetical protein